MGKRIITVTATFDTGGFPANALTPKETVQKMAKQQMEEKFSQDEGYAGVEVEVADFPDTAASGMEKPKEGSLPVDGSLPTAEWMDSMAVDVQECVRMAAQGKLKDCSGCRFQLSFLMPCRWAGQRLQQGMVKPGDIPHGEPDGSGGEIEKAKKLLKANGYVVKQWTDTMGKDAKECEEMSEKGKDKDCCGCSCALCIAQ